MSRLFIVVSLCVLALVVPASTRAQTTRYNPGDRVQCDLTRIGKWESGTVLSVHDEVWGTYYKVKIDGDDYDSWNCDPGYMRPAPAPAPAAATPPPAPATAAAPAKPTAAKPAATGGGGGGGLRVGEYACYGSSGSVLIGLGFKVVAAGRTTDLDGGNPGTYSIQGTNVVFRGGHLDGQTGRSLNDGRFTIGTMANCEPW